MRVRAIGKWLGLVFVVAIGPVLMEIARGRARASAETGLGRAENEEVAAARALVSVLEAKLRTTESNLKKAKELLANLQEGGQAVRFDTTIAGGFSIGVPPGSKPVEAKPSASGGSDGHLVEGVWRIAGVGGNQGGEFSKPGYDEYKIMTAGHYLWLSFDPETGEVVRSGGGTYTLKDGAYTARVECSNSEDLRAIIGQEYKGTCRVDGKKWFHHGSMPNGAVFDELWERVN